MDQEKTFKPNPADHLANERTFLAWIRTGIGIMGFGFVVVKFSLFVRQVSAAMGVPLKVPQSGYSHIIGIILVGLGALIVTFAYARYIKTKNQIDTGFYYHSTILIKIVTGLIFLASVLLLGYLIRTT